MQERVRPEAVRREEAVARSISESPSHQATKPCFGICARRYTSFRVSTGSADDTGCPMTCDQVGFAGTHVDRGESCTAQSWGRTAWTTNLPQPPSALFYGRLARLGASR